MQKKVLLLGVLVCLRAFQASGQTNGSEMDPAVPEGSGCEGVFASSYTDSCEEAFAAPEEDEPARSTHEDDTCDADVCTTVTREAMHHFFNDLIEAIGQAEQQGSGAGCADDGDMCISPVYE